MRFCSLGSGSTGNAALVETSDVTGRTTRLLIDCGFTLKELTQRLAQRELEAAQIDAIFVTHEHGDHVGCAFTLAKRHGIPVWTSRGTWRAAGEPALDDALLQFARDGEAIEVRGLQLHPYTVPHDAAEPLQVVCSDGARKLGVLTDAGSITGHLLTALAGCDALLLECNHDRAMLAASSYPASLKARVGGRLGHLANDSAAEVLSVCRHGGLRHVVAAHLSQQNNRPELAAAALAEALGTQAEEIVVATAQAGFDWLGLG
jgi:phosphoribosyl 1,2-cyclic phosphodiesterase